LTEQACDEVQGYLISPPIKAVDIPQFLQAGMHAVAV
jgi:EAL domain-containing protein (putative c-di-GMP-specific phosphodiesterase class I)